MKNDNVLPLVTAVMTTYERPVSIVQRALQSILNQTYSNMEIIVVNDSPDNAQLVEEIKTLCNSYASHHTIHYVVQETNGGACKARNTALRMAHGKYLAYLDDDDRWAKNKIELQVKCAEADSNSVLIYCNSIKCYAFDSNEKRVIDDAIYAPVGDVHKLLFEKNFIGSCSFPLFRTSVLKRCGTFNEDLPALQDWDLYLRISLFGSVAYVQEPLAYYYFYDGERISHHPERRTRAFELIQQEFMQELLEDSRIASSFWLAGTYFYSVNRDMKTAFHYYRKGVSANPMAMKRNIRDFFRMALRPFAKTVI